MCLLNWRADHGPHCSIPSNWSIKCLSRRHVNNGYDGRDIRRSWLRWRILVVVIWLLVLIVIHSMLSPMKMFVMRHIR